MVFVIVVFLCLPSSCTITLLSVIIIIIIIIVINIIITIILHIMALADVTYEILVGELGEVG